MKTSIKLIASTVFIVAAAFSVETCNAQSESSCSAGHCGSNVHLVTPHVYKGYHSYPRYGYGYRPYGYDYRFGVADLVRATAQANVLNAHARTQHLHADKIQMENSVQFLATRLERKAINKESRFGHLHERGRLVREAKQAAAQQRAEMMPAPQRAVDPVSGRVAWPMLLRSSYYANARRPIDQVFHERTQAGSINPDHFLPMRDWIEKIECELKANVAYYEMADYLQAKAFLRELIEEARIDLDVAQVGPQLVAR